MSGPASFDQETRLRRLFADLLIKKGYEKEAYLLDLSAFLKSHGVYTLSEVKELWKEHLSRPGNGQHYFSLYVHIPFCRKRCSFCRHYEWTCGSENQLRLYLDSLIFEVRAFKEIFSGVVFKSLYVGGGTANILSPELIDRLLSEIGRNFKFDDHAEKTFECNPNESSGEKLSVFADHGINRVSFGVQSYSQDVLECTHRAHQSEEMVASAIRDAQKFPAFHKINADLLIGLHNDSPQTVCDSFLKLAQLGAGSISLYALKPPLNYIKKHYQGRQDLYDGELSKKLQDFERLVAPIAQEFDYVFTPLKEIKANFDAWMFTLRKNYHTERVYKYVTAEFPIDCLGIGTGAVSTITGHAFYKNQSFTPSAQGGTYEENGRYRGCLKYGLKEQQVLFILGEIATWNRVSRTQYRGMFGTDMTADFAEELSRLSELGVVSLTDTFVIFERMRPQERFFYALFFWDHKMIFDAMEMLKTKV